MRPVNLLPEGDRARRPPGDSTSASYIVLGVLGVLLLAVVAFVVTQNQVNSRTSDLARAKQETQEAEQRAARLGAFGEFAAVKETRLQSVRDLAASRFDWERLMRELALVLPEDTWITEASASASGQSEATATAAPSGETPPSGGPSLSLTGCAPSQTVVAKVMVRLRNLHRVQDVELGESAEPDREAGGTTGAGTAPQTASEPTASSDGCGQRYKFQTTVTFAPAPVAGPAGEDGDRVPATLGGGS